MRLILPGRGPGVEAMARPLKYTARMGIRRRLLRFRSATLVWLLPLWLAGPHVDAADSRRAADPAIGEAVMRKWSRSCTLCHVTGNGGAPRAGHPEDWQARLAQGKDTLLAHAVEGYNRMPPLGYCMSCERDDLVTLIDFMSAPVPVPATGSSATELSGAKSP